MSGLLLALCYPRWNQGWLCWIALTPLIWALWFAPGEGGGKRPWLKKAGLGYVAGITFFTTTFFWLGSLAKLMDNVWLLALPLLLALYLALYFAFWGWFVGCVAFRPDPETEQKLLSSRHNLQLAILCACAWVVQEWLRGIVFTGFGWNGLGVALHQSIALIQVADITGVLGLSFVVAMANVIAVLTIRRFALEIRKGKLRPHYDFNLTIALVGLVFAYGVHALLQHPKTFPLRITAIQGDIPINDKFTPEFEDKVFKRYRDLTDAAMITNPQLVLWSESATPRGMFADETNFHFVMNLVTKGDFSLMLGTLDFDQKGDYNSAVLIDKGVNEFQTYHKIHLVPFGEYIPFRHSFPVFAWISGDLVPGDFTAGTDYTVLRMKNPAVKLGPLICFEDTLGNLTRHFVLNGAQVLVNLTNDGWFLKSAGAEQHLANALFRCAETHRPLVRCANTGVTCLVDSYGRVTQSLRSASGDPFTEGLLSGVVNVPEDGPVTFYVRHGEWFPAVAGVLTLGALALHFNRLQGAKRKQAA